MTIHTTKLIKPEYIIFIDDEETCHEVIKLIVHHKTDYEILSAYNARQAIELLETYFRHVHLIFLDMLLPDMNGMELYNIIKRNPKMMHIPIVFQTGIALSENSGLQELRKNNNHENTLILSKPYTSKQLIDIINSVSRQNQPSDT